MKYPYWYCHEPFSREFLLVYSKSRKYVILYERYSYQYMDSNGLMTAGVDLQWQYLVWKIHGMIWYRVRRRDSCMVFARVNEWKYRLRIIHRVNGNEWKWAIASHNVCHLGIDVHRKSRESLSDKCFCMSRSFWEDHGSKC